MQYEVGVMQGRLSPPEDGRFQSFPRISWREEFPRAEQAGFKYIEWIFDEYGADANPIVTAEGRWEINALKAQYKIAVRALCADWLMDFPLIRCSKEEQEHRESRLHEFLRWAQEIGARRIVLPCVDNASMRTEAEQQTVVEILRRALPVAEETGVELHLEADFAPRDFAAFLEQIPHPMLKVNYDIGNSSGLGYVAKEEFAAYGARIGSIHVKDRLRKPDGGVASMPLGKGSADLPSVFACIRNINYRGGLTFQVARGNDGEEVSWLKDQIASLQQYLS